MALMKISWIICIAVWCVLIVGCIVLRIVNKFRNRSYKNDDPGSDGSDDADKGGFYVS